MYYSTQHCIGGNVCTETFKGQSFPQLAHAYGQNTAVPFDDVPQENGQLSNALKQKLAEMGLLDMEVILRYSGIHTRRALDDLNPMEKTVLLTKARQLYEVLGIFPSSLKNTLNMMFGNLPPQSMYQGSPWAMQAGKMPWSQQVVPSQPSVSTEPLTDALCGDTFLKRSLGAALLGASEIVGLERYTECLRRLKRSNEHVVASCLEAAEALAALGNSNTNAHNREQKEALKLAKKAVRDVLLWRCTGNALGLDSRDAMVRAFEETCHHTGCDGNTVSQLTNGYRKIVEELKKSIDANLVDGAPGSQGRQQQPQQQATGTATSEGGGTSGSSWQAAAKGPNSVIDPMGPSSSDPVLPHPADPEGLHGPPMLPHPADPEGLHGPPRHVRSLPPNRRSPGPRSRDSGCSLQMAQMMEMMKAMAHHLQEVRAQVGKFQQDHNPFPSMPVVTYNDDDDEDDAPD